MTFFGSPNVAVHLLRGIVGIALVVVALQYASTWGWWTLVPAIVAFVCLGGCPMCWTVGLVDTILRRKKAGCPTCGH
jgi:hypothetical protein